MTTDEAMAAAKEALGDLGRRIKQEEAKAHEKIGRVRDWARDSEDSYRQEKDIWREFHMTIEPMQREQQHILRQIVAIKSCEPPEPIVLVNGEPRKAEELR